MRLVHSPPSGGRAINRMSGSTSPGKDAATPIVSLLDLLCSNAGVPLLVTWTGRAGLGPVLSARRFQHPSPESLLSFHPHLLPTGVQIPDPCRTHSAQGFPLSSCVSTLLPHFRGHRALGTWVKLLSNMGSGRRGRYSAIWRVFCISPRMGTHFGGSGGGGGLKKFHNRLIVAARTSGGGT